MPGREIGRLRRGAELQGKIRNRAEESLRNPIFGAFIVSSYIDMCENHESYLTVCSETTLNKSGCQHGSSVSFFVL